jgi:hypothetical protein
MYTSFEVASDWGMINTCGSSLVDRIDIEYHRLVEIFGQPTYLGDIDGKVRCEWIIEFYDETYNEYTIATIYDWKEDPSKPVEWVRDWHVGGFRRQAFDCVIDALFGSVLCN